MRLSWLTTEYSTGYPFIGPGALTWALVIVAWEAIHGHNTVGAGVGGAVLLTGAVSQFVMHRATLAHERRTTDG